MGKNRLKAMFRRRLLFIVICAVALCIIVIWTLSILAIIPLVAASILSAFVSVLGVLTSVLPHLIHRPLEKSLPPPSNNITAPIWLVPYRRNAFFVGREDALNQIHDNLVKKNSTNLAQPQVLIGLGGIGKTQLAIEHAYRYREEYHWVFWLRADTRDTLITDIMRILDLLSLAKGDDQDQDNIIFSFKRWLMTHSQWLLILDNADDLQVVYDLLLESNGHILLTTRARAVGSIGNNIEVREMNREEGILFLLRRAGLLKPNASLDAVSEEDRADAEAIVEAVAGLPLALDQAGAYIHEVGCRLSDYQHYYANERQRQELLKRRGALQVDHPESVASTFSLSFQKIAQADPAAADLLRFFAFLSPDDIPEELIQNSLEELGETLQKLTAEPPVQLNEVIAKLLNYSLVRRNSDSQAFSIHRLVQTVIRNMMDEDTQRLWAERTVRAVNHVFPEVTNINRSLCRRLIPQVRECFGFIRDWNLQFPEAASLLHRAASYLRKWLFQRKEAESFDQQALSIQEQVLDSMHIDVAETLYGLALTYRQLNKYGQSESFYQRALAIYEHQLGSQAIRTLEVQGSLGYLYYKQGKYDEAASLHQQILAIREQILPPDAIAISTSLNNLALVYTEQGKYKEAQELYEHALDIRKQKNARSINVAIVLNNLGKLYEKQGKYEQAESLYQEAIAIRQENFGEKSRGSTTVLKNLADLYRVQRKYRKAELLYQTLFSIWKESIGLEYVEAAEVLENYADVLSKLRRRKEAIALKAEAKAIRDKVSSQENAS